MNRKIDIFVLAALAIIFLAGCTISNGVFVGMSQSSSDTSLCASLYRLTAPWRAAFL